MNTCKTCKWWQRFNPAAEGACNNPTVKRFTETQRWGAFAPTKDFACNQWELKDDERD